MRAMSFGVRQTKPRWRHQIQSEGGRCEIVYARGRCYCRRGRVSGTEGHVTPSHGGGGVTKSIEGNINLDLECMFGNVRKTRGPAGATRRSQEAPSSTWGSLASGLAADLTVRRFGPVRTGSPGSGPPPDRNWTLGPVQPRCRILDRTWVRFTEVRVRTKVQNRTAASLDTEQGDKLQVLPHGSELTVPMS